VAVVRVKYELKRLDRLTVRSVATNPKFELSFNQDGTDVLFKLVKKVKPERGE